MTPSSPPTPAPMGERPCSTGGLQAVTAQLSLHKYKVQLNALCQCFTAAERWAWGLIPLLGHRPAADRGEHPRVTLRKHAPRRDARMCSPPRQHMLARSALLLSMKSSAASSSLETPRGPCQPVTGFPSCRDQVTRGGGEPSTRHSRLTLSPTSTAVSPRGSGK